MRMGSIALVGVAALVALAGCSGKADSSGKESGAQGAAINSTCPIGGHEVDATLVRQWKGQNVAFCCDGCTAKWDKMTDAQRDEVYAVATGASAK